MFALAQVLHILWVEINHCLAWQVPVVCTWDWVGAEQGAAGEVGMSSAFCAPSCGNMCSFWSCCSDCANSTCLSQLQLFLLPGKFEPALGMELSATERIEGLDNMLEILQEGRNQTF